MSALREVDRDLDQIVVDADRLTEVRRGVAARGKLGLAAADRELAALGSHVPPAIPVTRSQARVDTEPPPSGQIDVPDEVLASAELPAVLAIQRPTPEPVEPLSLDLDSGETPLEGEDELAPVPTSASMLLPVEMAPPPAEPEREPSTEAVSLVDAGLDDPSADLASLLGDSDPMREEGAVPIAPTEIEPEATTMFSAEDAERFSRPAPPMNDDDLAEPSDVELDLDEVIELEDEEPAVVAAPRARTAPPPPPRTAPPPPPGPRPTDAPPGFLGKLLQRKP